MKTEMNPNASLKSAVFTSAAVIVTAAFFLVAGSAEAKSQAGQPPLSNKIESARKAPSDSQAGESKNAKKQNQPAVQSQGEINRTLFAPNATTVASNYTFSTATNASLTDMSTGTIRCLFLTSTTRRHR